MFLRTALALVFWALFAGRLFAQDPNLLVEVKLVGIAHRTVEAILTEDSTLLLPAGEVHQLLGLGTPTTSWITPQALATQFPSLVVTWLPREMRLRIEDPLEVLPATRQFRDQRQRQARGAPGLTVTRSGPFLALAADDSGRSLVDFGYSWRGQVAVQLRESSTLGPSWAVSLAPSPKLFIAYSDGQRQSPTASARLATGPAWLSASWTPDRTSIDGLVVLARGRVSVFASTREVYVLTIKGPGGDFQLGRSAGRTAARFSWGPLPASPFSPPQVP